MSSEIRNSLLSMEAEAGLLRMEIELNGTRVQFRLPKARSEAEVGVISGVFGEIDGGVEVLGR